VFSETYQNPEPMSTPLVSIIMGSESDLPVMQQAAEVLKDFEVDHELTIVSAHRTPHRMVSFATEAHGRGLRVIIAGAGGAAHLPGMVASLTTLPVIGVPVKSSNSIDGIDSLYSIVQMPAGIPVATVAINNARNAALLAIRILATTDVGLHQALVAYQAQLQEAVLDSAKRVEYTQLY
jgi:5-(carboxyamino)imidazole ribonucleotide mutase